MNINFIRDNPIEVLRIKQGLSQKDFSNTLGYPNVNQYVYNMKEFTRDIIVKINTMYGVDITMNAIAYLKHLNKKYRISRPATKPQVTVSNKSMDILENVADLVVKGKTNGFAQ